MSENLNKLKKLLAELFQLDQADLDFGIYRIMNAKRDEITRFLDNDLLPQIQEAFREYRSANKTSIQAELDQVIEQARGLAIDPDAIPKVKELREKFAQAVDVTALENEVYSHLYNFFRRYYSEGDFISLRRYKEGVYAIPYEGEEVKLHWANHDQYYIKTSENFRNYTFKLLSGKKVTFKIVDAETARDNIKAANGNERRFMLCSEAPLKEENEELFIRFVFEADPEKRKQAELNSRTLEKIREISGFNEWKTELFQPRPTEKNPNRTLLEKHLNDYTSRNTFDYFIHKNLGGFLRRELDFYIKNEVMHLDDIENETTPRVEQYLSKIKVIRKIAHKLIEFLAQLENFQKKLWLKRKFVVETNYCVTLDRVPEELYPEIAANEAQREEWVKLFAIDEIKGDLTGAKAYSEPLTVEFLKANPFLVIDTKHFAQKFKDRLLASFEDIEGKCDGVLLRSENYQGLNLINPTYQAQFNCIYIDPPFNSPSSEILYKNDYKHSSWLTLLADRIDLTKGLLSDGVYVVAIDENEQERIGLLFENTWIGSFKKVCVSIRHNPRGIQGKNFSHCHEYAYFLYPSDAKKYIGERNLEEPDTRNLRDSGIESDRSDAKNCFYPIIVRDNSIVAVGDVPSDDFHPSGVNESNPDGTISIWPIDTSGNEKKWRYARQSVEAILPKLQVRETRRKCEIYFAKDTGTVRTLWTEAQFDASEYGTKLLQDLFGTKDLDFSYPKSLYTLTETLRVTTKADKKQYILDYFSGSGTTGHATIYLNREDGGSRKYILVEMGEYFDTVLVPRIKKVVYSKDWKNGKPVSREGISHMFKYIRLESYEDTLNNLVLSRTETQQRLLEESFSFRESYMLSYMLDVEGRDSLLNIDVFEDPFNYKLNISTGIVGETKSTTVDLVETFNYLLGLTVHHIDHIRGFRVVQGTSPKGEKVLVIWRNLKEKSNDDLDEFFRRQEYNPKDMEFDLIYVNGDNNLENLRREDETWKVRLIEEDFKRLMFDVEDV